MQRKDGPDVATLPRLYALALGFCLAPSVLAAPTELTALPFEELLTMDVFSASKFTQKLSEAPSSVTVLTAADIRAYGWRTLADAVRSVRGLYVNYDRNYSYLGARGFLRPGDYNTRFLLLIDGIRVNDAVYDQAPLGSEFPLDLELVDRIEFVPGPGSSIYGSNAFFGVINVITRKIAEQRASVEAGRGQAVFASAGNADFMLAASARKDRGRNLYFPDYAGFANGLDFERGQRLYAKAARGAFVLTVFHAQRTKGIPTASFNQPFNVPGSQTLDTQTYADLSTRLQGFSASLHWGAYDSVGDYINDDAVRSKNLDGSKGRWWGLDLKWSGAPWHGHKLVAGLDFQDDYRLHQFTYNIAPYVSFLDERRSARRSGLYATDELMLAEDWRLNLGLRYDRNSHIEAVWSPRAAIIHQLAPATTLKAIYGAAYRAPNSYELYYSYPGAEGQLANPALQRERITTSELALVQQLPGQARLTVSAFRNAVSGLIVQMSVPPLDSAQFQNIERVRTQGLELEYERHWPNGAALRTSYSATRINQSAANTPEQLFKFNLSGPLPWAPWRAALETQYVGARGLAGGYWLCNANLYSQHLTPHVDVAISVGNVLDRRYADPASTEHVQKTLEQDGRSARLRVNYAF